MPPKKKGNGKSGKGKKKKGSGKAKKQQPPINTAVKYEEGSKEFYLVQIKDLESRLLRYQKRCDELEVANGQFQDKFDQLTTDKKEIVSFWKRQNDLKSEEIADLNDRYIGLQQARDNEREAFKKQIQEQRSEYQEMKDQLTAENMMLGGKLASLEEFKVQKEELMAKFAMMEAELLRKEEENKENLYELEKKAVIDKDRLKKEMILRVNQVAAEFRKVSNKQMAETTKRTIRENVSITAQLAKMSDKTIEMIQENDQLEEKVKKLLLQVEMMEANEREMSRKNQSNLKVIKMMAEKCHSMEALIGEYERRENELMNLENEAEAIKQENEILKQQLETLCKSKGNVEDSLKNMKTELKAEVDLRSRIENVLEEAAKAIKQVLIENPEAEGQSNAELPISEEDGEEKGNEVTEMEDKADTSTMYFRDNMLDKLLVVLDSAANLGLGPNPDELGRKPTEELPKVGPSSSMYLQKIIPKGEFQTHKTIQPHYNLGDLGLVPRPSHHVPTSLEKTQVSSARLTKLGSLHGVLAKSVATQTINSANAVIFASQVVSKFPEHSILKNVKSAHKTFGLSPLPIPKKAANKI